MAGGLRTELEEIGLVGMIGVFVVPGLMWVVEAKTGGAALRRLLVVSGAVAAALALEAVLDHSANSVVETVAGK